MTLVFISRAEPPMNVGPDFIKKAQTRFAALPHPPVEFGEVAHQIFQRVGAKLVVYPIRVAGDLSVTAEAALFQDEVAKDIRHYPNLLWPRCNDPVCRKRIDRAQDLVDWPLEKFLCTPLKCGVISVNGAERRHEMQNSTRWVDSKCDALKVQFFYEVIEDCRLAR